MLYNKALQIIFEKHLFNSSEQRNAMLPDLVLKDFMDYLRRGTAIIRSHDEEIIEQDIKDEILELLGATIGPENDIRNFLENLEDLAQKQRETNERYFELFEPEIC